ncbi:hypothetical protein LZ31DRAFT_550743, partial [Colletotrichum somersetense]
MPPFTSPAVAHQSTGRGPVLGCCWCVYCAYCCKSRKSCGKQAATQMLRLPSQPARQPALHFSPCQSITVVVQASVIDDSYLRLPYR